MSKTLWLGAICLEENALKVKCYFISFNAFSMKFILP